MADNNSGTSFDERKAHLEALAVQVYADILSDSRVDPSVRKSTADAVMKAIGKDAPVRNTGPGTVVFSFSGGLKTALQGMGQLQGLLERPAPDQETTEVEE
jgi:hypothetical protein